MLSILFLRFEGRDVVAPQLEELLRAFNPLFEIPVVVPRRRDLVDRQEEAFNPLFEIQKRSVETKVDNAEPRFQSSF